MRKNMEKCEKNGVEFYRPFQNADIISAVSTRRGGVTPGYLGTLNLGLSCGDSAENIRENLRRFGEAAGFLPENVVYTKQEHTAIVRRVDKSHCGMGVSRPRFDTPADGLITNVPGVALLAYFADCVPVLLYDPVKKAIGSVHSGWRGTVGKIAAVTISEMEKAFGTNPSDVEAFIGPSIGPCCFLVDAPVQAEFQRAFPKENGFSEKFGEKYKINLWAAVGKTLEEAGVGQITCADICTACHSDIFYSHRKTGGRRGLFAAVMMLKE